MRSRARIIHSLCRAIVPNAELRLSFTKTFKQSVFTVKLLRPREVRLGVMSAGLTTQFPRKKQSNRFFFAFNMRNLVESERLKKLQLY